MMMKNYLKFQLNILKKMYILEKIYKNEIIEGMNYKHISFLYSITYIKNYLSNFVDILFDQERYQLIG
jgi:hypothetical protein